MNDKAKKQQQKIKTKESRSFSKGRVNELAGPIGGENGCKIKKERNEGDETGIPSVISGRSSHVLGETPSINQCLRRVDARCIINTAPVTEAKSNASRNVMPAVLSFFLFATHTHATHTGLVSVYLSVSLPLRLSLSFFLSVSDKIEHEIRICGSEANRSVYVRADSA